MAYKTNRLGNGLALGSVINWKILKADPRDQSVHRYHAILHYITALYRNYIQLPKKNVKTKRKTSRDKRFRIPILMGSTLFSVSRTRLLFRVHFYYDYLKLSKFER